MLVDEWMDECSYVTMIEEADGYGGTIPTWGLGTSFMAAFVLNVSVENKRADKEDIRNTYTVITSRDITLMHGDIIKRLSDDKFFWITSDGTDKKTPLSSTLDMRVVTAEEMDSLPDGEV